MTVMITYIFISEYVVYLLHVMRQTTAQGTTFPTLFVERGKDTRCNSYFILTEADVDHVLTQHDLISYFNPLIIQRLKFKFSFVAPTHFLQKKYGEIVKISRK